MRQRRQATAERVERESAPPPPSLTRGETRVVPIDSIAPHPENARAGNVPAIKESIRQFGFYGSVIVWKSAGQIIVGSHRWLAARELGMARIPATFLDVDERTARRIMAADNRASDLASYDDARLAEMLRRLVEDDALAGTNFAPSDLDDALKRLEPAKPPGEFLNLDPGGMHLARKCPRCGLEF